MAGRSRTDVVAEAAAQRFSDADSAQKWTDMYASETERLDEANFRRRRDITVEYTLNVLPPGGRVVDLGCGAAPVVSELRRRGVSCTGLEYADDMLKHARDRLRALGLDDGDLHQGDCRHTPFETESFDVVVSLGVISYIEHYDEALAEIRRLLKPNGFALISFRNRFNPVLSDPVRAGITGIRALAGKLPPEPYKIGRFMDHREFQQKMGDHGFLYRDFFGIGFGPFKLHNHKMFSERTSIRISDTLTRGFSAVGMHWPFKWLADVSLWIYQKDSAAARQS